MTIICGYSSKSKLISDTSIPLENNILFFNVNFSIFLTYWIINHLKFYKQSIGTKDVEQMLCMIPARIIIFVSSKLVINRAIHASGQTYKTFIILFKIAPINTWTIKETTILIYWTISNGSKLVNSFKTLIIHTKDCNVSRFALLLFVIICEVKFRTRNKFYTFFLASITHFHKVVTRSVICNRHCWHSNFRCFLCKIIRFVATVKK